MLDWQIQLHLYKEIGYKVIIEACSSALYVLCKNQPKPLNHGNMHWRYRESLDALAFIQSGGIQWVTERYQLDISPYVIERIFYEQANSISISRGNSCMHVSFSWDNNGRKEAQ